MVRLAFVFIPAFFVAVVAYPGSFKTSLLQTNGRIVGGVETTIEKFPFQASLRLFGYHKCGAVIIKVDIVLTAAHCVDQQDSWYISVKAGSSEWDGDGGVVRNVNSFIIHEDFSMQTIDSDIALIFLEIGFDFTSIVQPIKLASAGEELKYGIKALVSGWGTLIEDGMYLPDQLQYTPVIIWDQKDCKAAYDGINEVTKRMFCAGEHEGGKDTCQGDSGGPLIVGSKLFGLISWGLGCARPGKPSVYTKISVLRPWIESNILKKSINHSRLDFNT